MEKYIDKLAPVFEKLAEKLGTTSEFVWEVLVKQAYIEGCLFMVMAGFGLALSISGVCTSKYALSDTCVRSDGEILGPLGIIGIVAGVIFTLVGLARIPMVLNPEYYAIKDILQALP